MNSHSYSWESLFVSYKVDGNWSRKWIICVHAKVIYIKFEVNVKYNIAQFFFTFKMHKGSCVEENRSRNPKGLFFSHNEGKSWAGNLFLFPISIVLSDHKCSNLSADPQQDCCLPVWIPKTHLPPFENSFPERNPLNIVPWKEIQIWLWLVSEFSFNYRFFSSH